MTTAAVGDDPGYRVQIVAGGSASRGRTTQAILKSLGLPTRAPPIAPSRPVSPDWTLAEREQALVEVARNGLRARVAGSEVHDLARELVRFSSEGLARIAERGETDADERHFLDPLVQTVESGKSPADFVLDAWRESGGSGERLLQRVRY